MTNSKNILVAPLNWGLGHATRCIPIIKALQQNGYTPVIASDGAALGLLQKEFPLLTAVRLPSYNIKYPKKGFFFKWKLLLSSPLILRAIIQEKKLVKHLVLEHNISGIISDNRMGMHHKKIPSVYITHQLRVLSGTSTYVSSKLHQNFIHKYTECWVPDIDTNNNYSGNLSLINTPFTHIKHLGILSRFQQRNSTIKYNYLVVISGPEPQRSLLEDILLNELKRTTKKTLFVGGKVEQTQKKSVINNITYYNFMTTVQLEEALNESDLVISRSGYTTIMDLAHLNKKAFLIPTPGQYEQLYLAQRMQDLRYAPYCLQKNFTLEKLQETINYNGFSREKESVDFKKLFSVFS